MQMLSVDLGCPSETCCAYYEISVMWECEVRFITLNNWMINGMIKLQGLFQVEDKLIKAIHLLDRGEIQFYEIRGQFFKALCWNT